MKIDTPDGEYLVQRQSLLIEEWSDLGRLFGFLVSGVVALLRGKHTLMVGPVIAIPIHEINARSGGMDA